MTVQGGGVTTCNVGRILPLFLLCFPISKPTAHAADPVLLLGIKELGCSAVRCESEQLQDMRGIILKSASRDHRRHWGAIVVKVLLVFVSDCVEG